MLSWVLFFYSMQIIITIWKELNGSDKYTPFITPSSNGYSFNMSSHYLHSLKENTTDTIRYTTSGDNEEKISTFSWEYIYWFKLILVRSHWSHHLIILLLPPWELPLILLPYDLLLPMVSLEHMMFVLVSTLTLVFSSNPFKPSLLKKVHSHSLNHPKKLLTAVLLYTVWITKWVIRNLWMNDLNCRYATIQKKKASTSYVNEENAHSVRIDWEFHWLGDW